MKIALERAARPKRGYNRSLRINSNYYQVPIFKIGTFFCAIFDIVDTQ